MQLTGQGIVVEVKDAEQGQVAGPPDRQRPGQVAALRCQHFQLVQAARLGPPCGGQRARQLPVSVEVQGAQRRERPIVRPCRWQCALQPTPDMLIVTVDTSQLMTWDTTTLLSRMKQSR